MKVKVRPSEESDQPFLIKTWLTNYRSHSPLARYLTDTVYYDNHAPIVRQLLGECRTLVAHIDEAPDEILGFICAEDDGLSLIVHYCYVKKDYRRGRSQHGLEEGVATTMMKASGYEEGDTIVATHITDVYTKQRIPHLKINNDPYRVWRLA